MIDVVMRSYNQGGYETTVVHVDADDVMILAKGARGDVLENDTLVLLKEAVEVAWFATWDYAIKVEPKENDEQ